MIQELLKKEFNIEVSERSVSNILARLGITPQLKAYEQDPESVRVWQEETWPAIQDEAKRRNAIIYFGDESAIRSGFHRGTTWGEEGKTPVVPKTGRRFSVNMISAVSPRGKLRFMVTDSRVTADVFIQFLKRLMHNAERPVYLVVDGHPTHKAKEVRKFVEGAKGKLKLFFLPPYSPELNPDELVWNHIKSHRLGRTVVERKEELRELAHSALRSLQRSKDLIKRFFHEKDVNYTLT